MLYSISKLTTIVTTFKNSSTLAPATNDENATKPFARKEENATKSL